MLINNLTSTVLLNYLRGNKSAAIDVSTIESTLKAHNSSLFVPYEEWEQRPEIQMRFNELLLSSAFDEGTYPMVNRLAAFIYISAISANLWLEISHLLLEEAKFMKPNRLNKIINKVKEYEPEYYVNLIFSRRVRVEGCTPGAEPTVRDLTLSVFNQTQLTGINPIDITDKLNEIGIKIIKVNGVSTIAVHLKSEKVQAMLRGSGNTPTSYRKIVTSFGGIDVLPYPIRVGLKACRVITIDPSWIFEHEIEVNQNV